MAEIQRILDRVENNQKPLVEQLLRQLRGQYIVRTADALAKFGNKDLESAIKTIEARNPFLELDEKARLALAQQILQVAKAIAEEEHKREETRRTRPAVPLVEFAQTVNVPTAVRDAWQSAAISSTDELFTPAAAKVLLDKDVPLTKRRELLAVSKLAIGSRNLKLSEALYKDGVTSLARLARMPKKRLDSILKKAKLDEDSRRDALELQGRARLLHRQTQALAVAHASARHSFGPAPAHYKSEKNLKAFHHFFELQQDPLEVTSSCATCTECENAFSPLGYLFDLVDFINDQWQVTVDDLERILLQKIKDLDCEQAGAPTAQIRIVIQILEKFIGGQILRNDSDWQNEYQATGDALVQLISQELELNPPLTNVAELAADQRFAGSQHAQSVVAALSSTAPTLAEVDAAERAVRAVVVADIEARYPFAQDPGPNASDDQVITQLLEESRQKQNRDIDAEKFDKQLAQLIEPVWIYYRNRLIEKTQKTAKELENLLFIHLTAAPCHRTTPITQLILSLQSFVLAVRTGEIAQLRQIPRLAGLIGDNDFSGFDEEIWSWLESYAKWSSAMYAFVYPENLMALPSLRPSATSAFTKALQSLSLSASQRDVEEALGDYEAHLRELNHLELLSAHVVGNNLLVFARQGSHGDLLMNTVDLVNRVSAGWKVVVEHKENFTFITVGPRYRGEFVEFIAGALRSHYNGGLAMRTYLIPLQGDSQPGPDVPFPDTVTGINPDVLPYIEPNLDSTGSPVTYAVWSGYRANNIRVYGFSSLSPEGDWSVPTMIDHNQSQNPDWIPEDAPKSIVAGEVYTCDINPGTYNELRLWKSGNFSSGWARNVTLSAQDVVTTTARLASNLSSAETYAVCSTADGDLLAVSRINLGSKTLLNDWLVISTGLDTLKKLIEDHSNSPETDQFPILLRNIYFEERHLYFPLMAAWALNRSGDYANAHRWLLSLYNPFNAEKQELFPFGQYFSGALARQQDWFGDALNPHNIGRQRSGVYLRHLILAMVKNLLDWADHEFTLNHAESLNQAGELYRLAEQILQAPELTNPCQEGLSALDFEIGRRYGLSAKDMFAGLDKLAGASDGKRTIEELLGLVRSGKSLKVIRRTGQNKIDSSLKAPEHTKFSSRLEAREKLLESIEYHHLSNDLSFFDSTITRRQSFIGDWIASLVVGTSGFNILLQISRNAVGRWQGLIMGQRLDELKINQQSAAIEFTQTANGFSFNGKLENDEIKGKAVSINNSIKKDVTFKRVWPGTNIGESVDIQIEPVRVTLCIPANPLLQAFSSHITIGLLALDSCRMISGELQPVTRVPAGALQDAVPTNLAQIASGVPLTIASDQPRYRYGYLLEQARQRALLAKQLGDVLLSALKERDQATYDLLLAQNARELSSATRDLKDLVRQEARDAQAVAGTQLERAEANKEFWNDRIKTGGPDGLSEHERQALQLLQSSARFAQQAAFMSLISTLPAAAVATVGAAATATQIGAPVGLVTFLGAIAAGSSGFASALQAFSQADASQANVLLTTAGFERRWEDWNLNNTNATFDAQLANLQVTLAQDRVQISDKDYEIVGLQYAHAHRVYEFLQNKSLNKELYEWMVAVLVEQYRAVMQSATSAAQLAQRALEFEWQAAVTIIKGDYWTVDAPSLREDQKGYGLLGAERLLTDLTRLDDFRLSVDKRRLQLSKTISLAQRSPTDFIRLQQTGRIEFETFTDWFDEDFPGHYLRLIKSVRVSILALVPPIDGIHASLTNAGASTVTFPDRPPQRSLRTFGESIALDSPYNESGLFVLDYNDPMLLPFEGLGVETHWVFELPRASNRFNFDTIADVLFTIEYTALQDAAYGERVRQRLGTSRSVNSVLSLRTSFPDQWYHLQNPLDISQPQVVSLNVPRTFFAPNLQNLLLKHLTVILAPADATAIQTVKNRLPQNGIRISVGGVDVNVDPDGIDPNSGSMTTMRSGQPGPGNPPFADSIFDSQNVAPFGNWQIRFAADLYTGDSGNPRALDLLADVLIVPTVEGYLV